MTDAPDDVRALLAAHTVAEEERLGRIEHAISSLASRDSSPPGRAERDVGRAWKYAAIVGGVIAAVIFTAFQVSAAVDGRIDRSLDSARELDTVIAEKRDGDTAHQLELMRRDDAMYRDELAKTLTRIEERLGALEHGR